MVKVEKKGKVGLITITRPDKLNALNQEALEALAEAVDELEKDPGVLAVVITGAGEKAFVAGADVGEILPLGESEGNSFSRKGQGVFARLRESKKVYIAAINGYALGGGLELALSCDIRLAAEGAQLGLPEVSLGLIPGYGGTQLLPRAVGFGWAAYIILTGDRMDAKKALELGLVQEVYPKDRLLEEALALAERVARRGPRALALAKRALWATLELPLSQGLELEARLFGEACATQDKAEGIRALLERRKPNFQGK